MTLQAADAAIIMDTVNPAESWCVFEHQVVLSQGEPPTVILIGACRLTEVYRLMDGKTNTEWMRIFRGGGSIMVRIIATTMDRHLAFRHAQDLVRKAEPKPICNIRGYSIRGQARAVICLNNGQRYSTQAEAAAALGIHASALSRHMRGDLSHAGGLRFVYDHGMEETPV